MNLLSLGMPIATGLLLAVSAVIARDLKPELGKPAPDFMLQDQNGKDHTLSEWQGQWVLLYFYPKDDTPGCTVEACTFRDGFEDFEKIKAKVVGVSMDDVKSHKAFADKHNLPFTLLADPEGKATQLYGVKKPLINMAQRQSFLIDPEGKLIKIYEDVKPADHPAEVLKDLEALMK
jgi:peroxiredoxin Q/BCP